MAIVVIEETAVIPAGSHQRAALMYSAISCVYICICNCICICICTVLFSKGSCRGQFSRQRSVLCSQCIGKTCSCGHLCAYIETICSREYAKNTCTYFFNSDQTQSHCNLFQKYGRKLFLQIKQNVIQFLLAMISGQLSNSRQSLIQLCAIQK